ncbi:hypothetical protein KBC04_02625 [Candidatus Babeliales bacterium]|nr:hypothetical protein [Candidatus Babeliales bacterium]MBP9844053.1 hypothetical protein [Candidatus Babeliales bacterium]
MTFVYLTCYCSFAMLDCFDGYPFINPLLPLVSWKWYLTGLPIIGTIGYWILVVMINVGFGLLIQKYHQSLLLLLLLLFLFPVCFNIHKPVFPFPLDDIVYLQPSWNNLDLTPAQQFYQISRELDVIALRHHKVKIIVIPESGFSHNLWAWKDHLGAWICLDDVNLFIGAHRYDHDKKYNSLYHIKNGTIVSWYDKTHLVPCVERIPWLLRKVFTGLFTDGDEVFSYPHNDQDCGEMCGMQPVICSELFCDKKLPVDNRPILFICNDSWLSLDYAKQLAQRSAQLYGLRHNCAILYVGSYDMKLLQ